MSNTPVNKDYQYNGSSTKIFSMIDNYVYLYHTDTLIAIPTYPESISDSMSATFTPTTPLARSAPIYSYSASGPRSFTVDLHLHRELMNQINTSASSLNVPNLDSEDYVDILIKQLQAVTLPRYAAAEKMVNPPIIAVRFGTDIFCKGVVAGAITTTFSGPILRNDKYALVDINFPINEIEPYDADSVMTLGSYRGLSTDLERRVWKSSGSGPNSGGVRAGGWTGSRSQVATTSSI